MTLTFAGIAKARLALFTVAGDAKRPAMEALLRGDDLPAARVHADEVVWLVDPAAAPPNLQQ
jgi:6-phosphogluconolactonase/glucosamine-6-phosphate isomerase/deaminase